MRWQFHLLCDCVFIYINYLLVRTCTISNGLVSLIAICVSVGAYHCRPFPVGAIFGVCPGAIHGVSSSGCHKTFPKHATEHVCREEQAGVDVFLLFFYLFSNGAGFVLSSVTLLILPSVIVNICNVSSSFGTGNRCSCLCLVFFVV